MEKFNPYIRSQNLSWSIIQIRVLLNQTERDRSSTFLSYAALECRMIIERLELAPLVMAASSLDDDSWKNELEKFKGIQKLNLKLKSLRFRYQSFTSAEAIYENCPLVPFDYKRAEDLESKLAKYIHVYNKADSDFIFESDFVKEGIEIVKEALYFLENLCANFEGSYRQGIIDFGMLNPEMRNEFNDWVTRKDEDIKALTARLNKIREENKMPKIKIDKYVP